MVEPTYSISKIITYTADQASKINQLHALIKVIEPRLIGVSFLSAPVGQDSVTSDMTIMFSGAEPLANEAAIWSTVDSFVPVATPEEIGLTNLKLFKVLLDATDNEIATYISNNVTDLNGAKALFEKILKIQRDILKVLYIKL